MDRLDSIGSADSTDQYPAFLPSDLRRRRLSSARQLGGRSAIKTCICDHRPAGTRQPVPLQMKSSKVPLVVIMFLYAINVGALMSLQAPFYPLEAQKKGATPAEYGFSFGITNLAAFIVSPISAKYGSKIGVLKLCTLGFYINAASCISFGFLAYTQHKATFIGLSYLLRCFIGIGDVLSYSSAIALLMGIFPNRETLVQASGETIISLGYSIGPAIGSVLYTAGGFSLPFFVLGSCILVLSVVALKLLRNERNSINLSTLIEENEGGDEPNEQITFRKVLTSFAFMNPFLDNLLVNCGMTFVESMLEPHMASEPINASPGQVGLTFLVGAVTYMVASLIGGLVCDKMEHPTLLSLLGNTVCLVGVLLVGPVPFLDPFVIPFLSYEYGVNAMINVGYAAIMVTTFSRAHKAVVRQGFDMNESGQLMVTGMWSATFYLGTFIGPTLAGVLVDWYGFKFTSILYSALFVLAIALNIVEIIYKRIVWGPEDYRTIP